MKERHDDMRKGGFSVLGSYHDVNQDSYLVGEFPYGYFMAVSDGVGSNRYSHIGSAGFCQAAKEVLHREDIVDLLSDKTALCVALHSSWLEHLQGENPEDCYATALLCVKTEHCVHFLRVGDGFLACVWQGDTLVLFDEKEDREDNETDSLCEQFILEQWDFVVKNIEGFRGAIASTDGIRMTNTEAVYSEFTKDMVEAYWGDSEEMIQSNLSDWVETWKSHDDKTIAYLLADMEN